MILQYVLMQFSFYQQIRETTPNDIRFQFRHLRAPNHVPRKDSDFLKFVNS